VIRDGVRASRRSPGATTPPAQTSQPPPPLHHRALPAPHRRRAGFAVLRRPLRRRGAAAGVSSPFQSLPARTRIADEALRLATCPLLPAEVGHSRDRSACAPRGASSRSASDFGAAAAFAFNTFEAEPIAELPTSGSPGSSEDTGHRHVRLARVRNVAPFASHRQVDEEAMQIPPAFALARDEVAGLRRQWCATLRRSRHTVG
jgi:hypothetical protein